MTSSLFESLANTIWTQPDCPPDVTLSVCEVSFVSDIFNSKGRPRLEAPLISARYSVRIQALLQGSVQYSLLPSLDRFSRWLRTVVMLLFDRGGTNNIEKAIGQYQFLLLFAFSDSG